MITFGVEMGNVERCLGKEKLHVGHNGERQVDCQPQGRRAELAGFGASCGQMAKHAMEGSGVVWPDTGGWDALAVLGRLGRCPLRPAK